MTIRPVQSIRFDPADYSVTLLRMKTLTQILAVLVLSSGMAAAQDLSGNANNSVSGVGQPGARSADVTGFRSPSNTWAANPRRASALCPTCTRICSPSSAASLSMARKYGTQLINPAAPASYGYGEKYLSAPSSRADLEHESGRAAHHDAGGIKLFSMEF